MYNTFYRRMRQASGR